MDRDSGFGDMATHPKIDVKGVHGGVGDLTYANGDIVYRPVSVQCCETVHIRSTTLWCKQPHTMPLCRLINH